MITTKQYLIFAGDSYYPTGPGDFIMAVDTLEEVRREMYLQYTEKKQDWVQYMDLETYDLGYFGIKSLVAEFGDPEVKS